MTSTALFSNDRPAGGIAVLATCFNRRETTVRGLTALRAAAGDLSYHVWLVDDGSTDGTGDAVRDAFPEVTVIGGDGSLYWNGGMLKAWQAALAQQAEYYLLFNDDLELRAGSLADLHAFQRLMEQRHGAKVISVGKVVDPETEETTYGGYARGPGLSRLHFVPVVDDSVPCYTMNGNCVLIPARAVADVGLLDPHYRHHSGDVDYGLRAGKAGYKIFQSSEPVGRTPFNAAFHAKQNRLTWANRHFILRHPKGIAVDEWLHFCRQHGGWLWPLNFVARYLKILRLRTKA